MADMQRLARSIVLFVIFLLLTRNLTGKRIRKVRKDIWINVESLVVAGDASVALRANVPQDTKRCTLVANFNYKFLVALRLLKYALAAHLVLLSNDVEIQPGPTPIKLVVSSSDSSFSTIYSSPSSCPSPCSSIDGSDYVDSTHLHFDLALPSSGLKIGHWNVNRLTSTKLDQIKLYLSRKDGKPQVDIMFLNETFSSQMFLTSYLMSMVLISSEGTGPIKVVVVLWDM